MYDHVHCNECDAVFLQEQSAYMHAIRMGHNVGVFHLEGDCDWKRATLTLRTADLAPHLC